MRFNNFFLLIICVLSLASCDNGKSSQQASSYVGGKKPMDNLRQSLRQVIGSRNVDIGIAILHLESHDSLSISGNRHYAMMSVCKFPQAITLLHLVDEGKLDKNVKVHISGNDLKQRTFSTLLKDHPETPIDLPLQEAFSYSIGQSDNITSNVIFDLEGGPAAVESYIHSIGIRDIGVDMDYRHMHNDSLYKNWITPIASVSLLDKFYTGRILTDSNKAMLWKAMVQATNGKNRLPGLLPANSIIGHKTGTSGRDSVTNIIYAFNDIGIMQLPGGQHVAIAVFIANSTLSDDDNSFLIAQIGKKVWDYFVVK